jgi:UbiD family decarboxylase
MSDDAAYQSLRGFISLLDRTHPGEVVRIAEPVDLAYQMQALALELERRRRFPVLIFEQVRGHSIPVISNDGGVQRARTARRQRDGAARNMPPVS